MSGEENIQGDEKAKERAMPSSEFPNEILQLIEKYAGGRIPVLVHANDPKLGLVNGELLKIYEKGFVGKNMASLGIVLARSDCRDKQMKWDVEHADYSVNLWSKDDWTRVCTTIRDRNDGEKACQDCDRERAKQAEEVGGVISYMCVHGMIDFAMPISVDGETVAVIFTGQRVPKKGSMWNKEFVEKHGVFFSKNSGGAGVDAWQVTLERFKDAEGKYGIKTGILLSKLNEDIAANPDIEVTSEEVKSIQEELKKAGKQLSELAESKYTLEKSRAVGSLRSTVAKCIAHQDVDIKDVSKTLSSVVIRLSEAADLICKYFRLEYLIVVNVKDESSAFRLLLKSAPSDAPWKIGEWVEGEDERSLLALSDALKGLPKFGDADLSPFRKLPLFGWVTSWLRGKQGNRCIAARLDHSGLPPCVLLGGKLTGLQLRDFRQRDTDDLRQLVEDIGMVINVLLFIDRLHSAGEAQELFLEDVAHDIRNPIQNLLFMLERLKFGVAGSKELMRQVERVSSQVRRIHQLGQRVWTLEQIRRGRLKLQDDWVKVHQVISEAVLTVRDMAEEKQVTIDVAREMEEWRAIKIDRNFFFQAMLNLIDNAVKYSHNNTEVRIEGKMSYPECEISVGNRGIEIKEQYRDKIGKRGFRTPEAEMHIRQGSGIGLCIVNAFAEKYKGGLKYECNQITGRDFLTIFRLTVSGALL